MMLPAHPQQHIRSGQRSKPVLWLVEGARKPLSEQNALLRHLLFEEQPQGLQTPLATQSPSASGVGPAPRSPALMKGGGSQ